MRPIRAASAVVTTAVIAAGCAAPTTSEHAATAPRLHVEIVDMRPHDVTAFTEGLDISGGELFESTGKTETSEVRVADLATGTERLRVRIPARFFGEGIAVTDTAIWQLTWRDGIAIQRDPRTLAERRRIGYEGEGWGLCAFGERLVMSDGSDTLTFRDPITFDRTGAVAVSGFAGAKLNELECAEDGTVYANTWPSDTILHIDPESGRVQAQIDASGLLDRPDISDDARGAAQVLNGIAQVPGTDRFLITGKYWPAIFEVRFVP